jgi:hypothetical protein
LYLCFLYPRAPSISHCFTLETLHHEMPNTIGTSFFLKYT